MTNFGWECPKCGQVYAPFVQKCQSCVALTQTTYGTHGMCFCPMDTAGRITHLVGCPYHLDNTAGKP